MVHTQRLIISVISGRTCDSRSIQACNISYKYLRHTLSFLDGLRITRSSLLSNLSKVIILKISGTLILWCIPLILFPSRLLDAIEFPEQESYMFIRMLGWAYLSLCVGYAFALKASLKG